jgi:hypothetical protein
MTAKAADPTFAVSGNLRVVAAYFSKISDCSGPSKETKARAVAVLSSASRACCSEDCKQDRRCRARTVDRWPCAICPFNSSGLRCFRHCPRRLRQSRKWPSAGVLDAALTKPEVPGHRSVSLIPCWIGLSSGFWNLTFRATLPNDSGEQRRARSFASFAPDNIVSIRERSTRRPESAAIWTPSLAARPQKSTNALSSTSIVANVKYLEGKPT